MPGEEEQHSSLGPGLSSGAHVYIIKGKVLDMETASEVQNMEQEIWGMEEEVHAWY